MKVSCLPWLSFEISLATPTIALVMSLCQTGVEVAPWRSMSVAGMHSQEPADTYSELRKHNENQRKFRGKWCMFSVLESTGGLSQEALSLLKAVYRFGSK